MLPKMPSLITFLVLAFFSSPSAQAIVTVTAQAPIPSTVPSYTDEALFTSAILNSTNTYRRQHNASALTWNATLAAFASAYLTSSPRVGPNCTFQHSGGPYGENLAIGYPNATASVQAWGDERRVYDFGHPSFSEQTGHFTQLVWKDTAAVGCGRRLCGHKGWYVVCEYWPRGNVGGEYGDEVDRQVSGPGFRKLWRDQGLLIAVSFLCVLIQTAIILSVVHFTRVL